MRKLYAIIILAALVSSCKKNDDSSNPDNKDKCGTANTWSDDVSDNLSTNDISGSTRTLFYENTSTPDNICPDDAASASFSVEPKNGIQLAGITTIQGKAYWGLGEERIISLTWNPTLKVYNGTMSGLNFKPFFGEAPGWVGITIIIKMPTGGSLMADTNYISAAVNSMNIDFFYSNF